MANHFVALIPVAGSWPPSTLQPVPINQRQADPAFKLFPQFSFSSSATEIQNLKPAAN